MKERKDHLSWEEYFMGLAKLSALRSKDPNTRVGACIVDKENKIISLGYNGMPIGCDDEFMPWGRDGDYLNSKYPFVCHAEVNAILNCSGRNIKNSILYTTLFPCNECAKIIIQSGIKQIVYESDKYQNDKTVFAAKKMFDITGVKYKQYTKTFKDISIEV